MTFPSSLGKDAGFFRISAPNDHLNPISRAGRAGGCRGSPPTSAAATTASLGLSPLLLSLTPQKGWGQNSERQGGPQVPPPGVWGPWGDAGFLWASKSSCLSNSGPMSPCGRTRGSSGPGVGGHGGTSQWGQGDTGGHPVKGRGTRDNISVGGRGYGGYLPTEGEVTRRGTLPARAGGHCGGTPLLRAGGHGGDTPQRAGGTARGQGRAEGQGGDTERVAGGAGAMLRSRPGAPGLYKGPGSAAPRPRDAAPDPGPAAPRPLLHHRGSAGPLRVPPAGPGPSLGLPPNPGPAAAAALRPLLRGPPGLGRPARGYRYRSPRPGTRRAPGTPLGTPFLLPTPSPARDTPQWAPSSPNGDPLPPPQGGTFGHLSK